MTPRLAEIIAAMLDAKLDAEAAAGARGTIVARPARARPRQTSGRDNPHRRGERR